MTVTALARGTTTGSLVTIIYISAQGTPGSNIHWDEHWDEHYQRLNLTLQSSPKPSSVCLQRLCKGGIRLCISTSVCKRRRKFTSKYVLVDFAGCMHGRMDCCAFCVLLRRYGGHAEGPVRTPRSLPDMMSPEHHTMRFTFMNQNLACMEGV